MNTRHRPLNRKKLYGLLIFLAAVIVSASVYFGGSDAPVEEKAKTASELLAEYEMKELNAWTGMGGNISKPPFLGFLWDMSYVCSFMQDGKIPLHDCSPDEPLMVDIAPHCPAIIAYRETPRKPYDPEFPNQVPDYVALLPLIDEIEAACAKLPSYKEKIFGCFTGTLLGQNGTHKLWMPRPCQGLNEIKPYIDNIRAELKEKSTTTDKGVSPHAE